MDAGVEDIKIVRTECRYGAGITCDHRATHLCNELVKIGKVYFRTRQKSVAKSRKLGIIHQAVLTEPPAAEQGSYEGSHNATKIDKDIENLETGITLRSIARIVVQLSDNGLKVAFEKAVAECDEEQRTASKRKKPCLILGSCENGERQYDITDSHDNKTGNDGSFVVLRSVGNDTAYEAKHIDTGVEERID